MHWEGFKMEEIKKQIKYRIDWIKKEISQTLPLLNEQDKFIFVNTQLGVIYDLALQSGDVNICNTIIKYRVKQKEEEEKLEAPQRQMLKNLDKIVESIMMEL